MDGGSHACAEVGGAGVDVAVLGIEHELAARLGSDRVSDSLDTSGQTIKHGSDVSAILHRDDPQLILLIDPGEEGLVLVVEDSTTLWPVTLHTSDLEVWISGHEEEMVVHELLTNLLAHSCQGEVGTSKVSFQI